MTIALGLIAGLTIAVLASRRSKPYTETDRLAERQAMRAQRRD